MRKKKWMLVLAVSLFLAMMFATTAFAAGTGDVADGSFWTLYPLICHAPALL